MYFVYLERFIATILLASNSGARKTQTRGFFCPGRRSSHLRSRLSLVTGKFGLSDQGRLARRNLPSMSEKYSITQRR